MILLWLLKTDIMTLGIESLSHSREMAGNMAGSFIRKYSYFSAEKYAIIFFSL
jgi:hypothetical protein